MHILIAMAIPNDIRRIHEAGTISLTHNTFIQCAYCVCAVLGANSLSALLIPFLPSCKRA